MQANDYYQVEIITRNYITFNIWVEYLMSYDCVQIIRLRKEYCVQKNSKQHKKCKYKCIMNAVL